MQREENGGIISSLSTVESGNTEYIIPEFAKNIHKYDESLC